MRFIVPIIVGLMVIGSMELSAASEINAVKGVLYQHDKKRSPFRKPEPPKIKKQKGSSGILANYPAEKFYVAGTVVQARKKWAYIVAPDGKRFKVEVGSVVGNQGAEVFEITEKYVILEEGSGPTRRVITLRVQGGRQ